MTDPLHQVIAALDRSADPSTDYDLNPEVKNSLPEGARLRPAAVLVPFQMVEDVPHVLLTKRASHLKHHPGQIAFPGGKQDDADADLTATALREAQEEVGLGPDNIEILGTFPAHVTVTAFHVTPILGRVLRPFDPVPEPGEVEEVFLVPLSHVATMENYSVQSRRWRGQRRHYYTVPFGPYYIWGATARILRGLAERMQA